MSNEREPTIREMAAAIQNLFVSMGFKWGIPGEIPSQGKIADRICDGIRTLIDDDRKCWTSSGRIRIERDRELGCFDVTIEIGSFNLDVEKLLEESSGK